jgi:hypothetical protein
MGRGRLAAASENGEGDDTDRLCLAAQSVSLTQSFVVQLLLPAPIAHVLRQSLPRIGPFAARSGGRCR